MGIKIGQTVSNLTTPRFFSTKKTEVKTFTPRTIGGQGDFCTCIKQCIPDLPAFTDEIGTDFYKNDKYAEFLNTIDGGTIEAILIKNGDTDNPTNLTDNTYGIYSNDVLGGNFRFEIDWFKVFTGLGYGNYKMNIKNLNGSGSIIQEIESPTFRLRKFSDKAAHGTVRIESVQSGILQHGSKYTGLSANAKFNQQIRIPGALVHTAQIIETDSEQLNNNERSQIQIKDQLSPEYELQLDLLGSSQANRILLDYLFASDVRVSDYNVYDYVFDPRDPLASFYRSIPLKRISTEFNPSRDTLRKSFKIGMEYNYKNVFKINP